MGLEHKAMEKTLKKVALIYLFCSIALAILVGAFMVIGSSNHPVIKSPFTRSVKPTFIHHSPPNLEIPTDWIENGGCPVQKGRIIACDKNSVLKNLGCDEIDINPNLGGLDDPVVKCISFPPDLHDSESHIIGGCATPLTTRVLC